MLIINRHLEKIINYKYFMQIAYKKILNKLYKNFK